MKFTFLPLLIPMVFFGAGFTAQAQVNSADSLALVDLYNNTTGTGWTNQTNWLTTAPVSTWYGVNVTGTSVTGINLASNNLAGIIPFSFGNMSSLKDLDLSQNQLSGGMPSSLGSLTSLKSLNLGQNQLSGTIPASLGNIVNLQSLNLSQNKFVNGIPVSFGNLVNLQTINLSQNHLTGNLSFLANLSSLTDIQLESNQLTGNIPSSLGSLSNLRTLLLADNQLSGTIPILPASLGSLHTSYLLLQNNKFTFSGLESLPAADTLHYAPQARIPYVITGGSLSVAAGGTITNDTFKLYRNGTLLATQVADSVFPLSQAGRYNVAVTNAAASQLTLLSDTAVITAAQMDSLALITFFNSTNGPGWVYKTNWLTSAPLSTWFGVTVIAGRVTNLSIGGNHLTGTLPPVLGKLDSLKILNLNSNSLTGTLPASLTNLVNLTEFILSYNLLSGNIPSSIGNLTKLTRFDLSRNNLSDSIPPSIGNLTKLTYLGLSGNNLSGSIPSSIGNLNKVTELYLENNKLTGSIPPSLGNLVNLPELNLNNNKLSGPIPSSIGNLIELSLLDLSNNQLSGSIPASLGNLTYLKSINFSNNQLSGNIPASLGNLSNLNSLDFSKNQLTGVIPPSLGALKNLYTLQISNNYLSGSIPAGFNYVMNIYLSHNQLSGSVGTLTSPNLSAVDFSYNQLSGAIPEAPNCTSLALDFSHNQFSGSIPSFLSISSRNYLKSLNLSYNQLSGNIPANIPFPANFHLDVSHNHLSGKVPLFWGKRVGYNDIQLYLNDNMFTFSGIESWVTYLEPGDTMVYSPQAAIPLIHNNDNTILSVSTGGEPLLCTFNLYKNGVLVQTKKADSVFTTDGSNGVYVITATDLILDKLTLFSDTLTVNTSSTILPAKPAIEYASYEYTDSTGWTHYYYNNNTPNNLTDDTLLLSLKKNGQNIGSIGDGTFAVKLVATAAAGSNTAVKLTNPLITNPTGYWVMNRYWQVTPTHEPTSDVGVRFYYNTQDLNDVNGSYPSHNLTNGKLIFYKTVGGNPDPSTNLAGATGIISILPGAVPSDTTWTYYALSDTTQYGEYSVAGFSGGGGGGTGNNQALPVLLVNFTANLAKNDVQLNWQTAQEINAGYYTVERSLTGRDYSVVGRINAAGNSTVTQTYKLTDYSAALLGASTLYYRLKITDKNGYITYSKVIAVNIAGGISGLLVYPNPAKNTATVIFSANVVSKFIIEITDFSGKTIKRTEGLSALGANKVIVDLHGYPQGSYLITLNGANIKQQNITLLKQ